MPMNPSNLVKFAEWDRSTPSDVGSRRQSRGCVAGRGGSIMQSRSRLSPSRDSRGPAAWLRPATPGSSVHHLLASRPVRQPEPGQPMSQPQPTARRGQSRWARKVTNTRARAWPSLTYGHATSPPAIPTEAGQQIHLPTETAGLTKKILPVLFMYSYHFCLISTHD